MTVWRRVWCKALDVRGPIARFMTPVTRNLKNEVPNASRKYPERKKGI
jgi:hypothetical protein